MDDFKIVRKKGPNHLVVNGVYEDVAGEAIIQQKFGKIFNSVSYIPQNLKKTFVLMSPSERLEFLETFAFDNYDINKLKDRAKSLIRESNDTLSKTIGNLQFANKLLEEKHVPKAIPFPAKVSRENQEKFVSNQKVKLENSSKILKKTEKELKELAQKKNKRDVSLLNKRHLEVMEADYMLGMSNLDGKISQISFTKEDFRDLEKRLELSITHKSLSNLAKNLSENKEKLQELMDKESTEMDERIEKLEKKIIETDVDDLEEQLGIWRELLHKKMERNALIISRKKITTSKTLKQANEEKSELDTQISEKESEIKSAKLEKESFGCPHCSGRVRFSNNTLMKLDLDFKGLDITLITKQHSELVSRRTNLVSEMGTIVERDTLDSKISKLSNEISELEDGETSISECDDFIKEITTKIVEFTNSNDELQNLKTNRKFSQTILNIQKQVKEEQRRYDEKVVFLSSYVPEDEEILREKISKMKAELHSKTTFLELREDIRKSLDAVTVDLFEVRKTLDSFTEHYEELITTKEEDVKFHTTRKNEIEKFMKDLGVWQQNEKEISEYQKLKGSVSELRKKEISDRGKYTAACCFRDYILESESIYISNLIGKINTHVQMYLEHFFPDNPISVRLSSFKENSKNESKPCINLDIDYKGVEHDLAMLSGGELSRVILSFTLAFADLYNSPLILLDECTASLDQELTTSVIEGLKDNFGEKLVILIAHQVVQGVFDKVVVFN